MALGRILVVDHSAAMRETLGILLGGDYEVQVATPEEYLSRLAADPKPWNLVILGAAEGTPAPAGPIGPETAVLRLVERVEGAAPTASSGVLPRRFSPFELRRRVEDLLSRPRSRPAPGAPPRRLEPPFIPPQAARLVQKAATHNLPLFLFGEPGVGKRSLAAALHAARGGGRFVAVRAGVFHSYPLGLEPTRGATIFLDRVDQLSDEGQQRLLDLLQPGGIVTTGGSRLLLVAAAENDLSGVLERGELSRELYHRLTVLATHLPPLRERNADIPFLAEALVREHCQSLGLADVQLTPGALERLSRYLWFGNLAELEAVLVRTLSIAQKSPIEADDLLFDTTTPPSREPAPAQPIRSGGAEPPAGQPFELIANELAHELKNPMVPLRTFAQHLRRARPIAADDKEMARLTGDAVDEMDRVVENLLEYGRFSQPDTQPVTLARVVEAALEYFEQRLGGSPASVERDAPPARAVVVDLEQVSFALANVLRTLTRGTDPQDAVRIAHPEPGTIVVSARGREVVSRKLSQLLPAARPGATNLPYGVALALNLIQRNGGSLTFEPRPPTTATVRLPLANSEEAKGPIHGATARSSR